MRPLESYIIYAALYSVWYGSAPLAYFVVIALGLLLLAHLVTEKPRWQFTLVYVYVSYLLFSIFVQPAVWPGGWLWVIFSTALLIGSSAVACLFPVAVFPALKGPFQHIGVQHLYLDLKNKARKYEVDMSCTELGIHVYYPSATTPSSQPGAQFLSFRVTNALGRYLNIPSFLFHPLSIARTRAVPNSSVADDGKFPVVILSHGLGGVANMYAIMASEFASQGYVVFVPTHNDQSACLAELSTTQVAFKRVVFGAGGEVERREQLRLRTAELEFVLDHVERVAKEGPYAGHLDLGKVALVGHSFGGATVVLAAARNAPRVHAVVTHDLWLPPLLKPSLHLPAGANISSLLATCSEEWYTTTPNPLLAQMISPDATLVGFPGTCHSNYSDVPMFSQLLSRKLNAIGPIDFREGMDLINKTQVAYLKKALFGQPEDFQAILGGTAGVVAFENGDFIKRIVPKKDG